VTAVFVLAAGVFVAFTVLSGSDGNGEALAVVSGVECERGERLDHHVHTHLTLIVEGEPVEVPGNIGVRPDCYFWLHTHSTDGLLHVEAPQPTDFTLGQFFDVWGQPLSATGMLGATPDGAHEVQATVNGESWNGDPADIPLNDRTTVVLEYGPPFVPPPEYNWGQQ
jgi:hypothetical protein